MLFCLRCASYCLHSFVWFSDFLVPGVWILVLQELLSLLTVIECLSRICCYLLVPVAFAIHVCSTLLFSCLYYFCKMAAFSAGSISLLTVALHVIKKVILPVFVRLMFNQIKGREILHLISYYFFYFTFLREGGGGIWVWGGEEASCAGSSWIWNLCFPCI